MRKRDLGETVAVALGSARSTRDHDRLPGKTLGLQFCGHLVLFWPPKPSLFHASRDIRSYFCCTASIGGRQKEEQQGRGVAARQAKGQRGRTGRQFIYSLCAQAVYKTNTETVYMRCLSNVRCQKDVHKLTERS